MQRPPELRRRIECREAERVDEPAEGACPNKVDVDRAYRQRLEADLVRWEADGVITPAVGTAIRVTLPPLASGINIAVVVAIVGGFQRALYGVVDELIVGRAARLADISRCFAEVARAGKPGMRKLAGVLGRAS